jgi:ergothioneine biosynthesis protein EgtB
VQLTHSKVISKKRFLSIRQRTEEICRSLVPEDTVVQPAEFVSPPKWHLAHTTWFFEQFVLTQTDDYTWFNKEYPYLFNSYYNNVGDRVTRNDRGLMTRPILQDVLDYRAHVDHAMANLLKRELPEELYDVIEIGLQHEQQHQELLFYDIKYILGHQPGFPRLNFPVKLEATRASGFVKISKGLYEIGHTGEGFCFDNELGRHKVYLNDFAISRQLVTNREYVEFIVAGGYQDFNLWHAEGWDFVQSNEINAPLYWHKTNEGWMQYTLNGYKKINPSEPLMHVSFYEAFAYAQWKGLRLPTEFEWEVASSQIHHGQLWEWTNSAYLPYPDYKKEDGALGEYNGKFMVNQMTLRGSSVVTSPNHSRSSYRNFFHPNMRWQYAGIRLAKSL